MLAEVLEVERPHHVGDIALAGDGRAVYFSRSPIPFVRDANPDELLAGDTPWLLHLGVYAYRISIGENRFDIGAAVAVVMVLITVILTIMYLRAMVRQEEI